MSRRRFGSVRSANSLYGDRTLEGSPSPLLKKHNGQLDSPEYPSRARELHMARRDIVRYRETRTDTDLVKEQAQIELYDATKIAKDLSSVIEESNTVTRAHTREIEALRRPRRRGDSRVDNHVENNKNFEQVMGELHLLKQELSMLKLDMANVLEEKSLAEKQAEAANEKMMFYTSSAEAISKEIEEANEEQVLVELAKIEALKEFGDIESERQEEAKHLSSVVEETRKRVEDITQEIDQSEQLETKLSETLSNVEVLQNELDLVKGMDKISSPMTDSLQVSEASFQREEDSEASPFLQSITERLEAAKKELAAVKEEGMQYMASMDVIRKEMKHITDETARIKKAEDKVDLTVQNLNSKLLRAKAKLEAVSASEEKAKSILSSLSLTLEQLKADDDAAKKEKEQASEEAATTKSEILKIESDIDVAEEKFEAAMQELEAVKSSEAIALENLKNLIETSMRARASAAQSSSSITISKFEYEYLTGRALVAEEIADKKVAAAQAWIEAIKASEKEILIKIDLAERELKESTVEEEEQEASRSGRQSSGQRMLEGQELQNWKQKRDKNAASGHRRSYGNLTPSRRVKLRKSASPGARQFNNFPIQKKKKVIPNLGKLFGGKKIENEE
ncbi:protein PLASTID MOVEMENT IMPAIRED 2-like [Argentina anserina]|uniref:protein PLASTID MOVEMENT IMPAIRED 2-like n=1 Tax=Argentina anserina TaxID=57926 RepID=UPI0021765714|nr:protein PLASTID MOVEMENT IMPAIRED 2-like [Potentilla anserina]